MEQDKLSNLIETTGEKEKRDLKRRRLLAKMEVQEKQNGDAINNVDQKELAWILKNVHFLPNERRDVGVFPRGELRGSPLSEAETARALKIFQGKAAETKSPVKNLLLFLQEFSSSKIT